MDIELRLAELGLVLPEPRESRFAHGKVVGNLLFTSAHTGGPQREGKVVRGKVGKELSLAEGYDACQACMLLVLGRAKKVLGDLNRISEIVKVTGYVSCSEDFFGASQAMDGASDLLLDLWGERGEHARTTVSVSHLTGNFPAEVELIASIE